MKSNKIICPVCGDGNLEQKSKSEAIEYNGSTVTVDGFLYSMCDACGSEMSTPEQSRSNKRLVLAARKEIDGSLASEKILGIRKKYGITQQEAATIFGGGSVAFSKYEKGDVVQSTPMDRLLRVSDAVPEAYYWLAEFANVPVHVKVKKDNFSFIESKGVYAVAYNTKIPVSINYKAANHSIDNLIFTDEEKYETESYISESLSVA